MVLPNAWDLQVENGYQKITYVEMYYVVSQFQEIASMPVMIIEYEMGQVRTLSNTTTIDT